MGYLGYKPADKPLTSADITDGIIVNADINSSAAIAYSKLNLANSVALTDLSATGTASSATFLRGDNTWGSAGASAGQVIQVVSATDTTQRSTTSTSFVTGSNTLSVTLTPSSTSNKVFLLVNTGYMENGSGTGYVVTIYRGATNIGDATYGLLFKLSDQSIGIIMYLDSPATTSSTTYQVYFRKYTGAGTVNLNYDGGTNAKATASITAMEVKG
jgi:hypothetical protein